SALVELRVGSAPTTSAEPVRTLTDARGVFRFRLRSADSVHVRVLRPGFRPVVAPSAFVRPQETIDLHIVLTQLPVRVATVEVHGSAVCGERADAAAWQLWEQARTVLQSTVLTERDSSLRVRTVEFQGEATPKGAVVVQDSSILDVPLERPFAQAHYDSLFRWGYIRRARDTVTYYAPNASVLTDERFVLGHCFQVVAADSTPAGVVGVRFEPARRPRFGYTDIAGVFWLDATNYLLRQIDFGYVNPPRGHQVLGTGGHVLFTQLATGHWVMSDWMIRMANLVLHRGPWERQRREDGSYYMERNGVIPLEAALVRGNYGLWARAQRIVSVQQGGQLLYFDEDAAAIARRAIPRVVEPPPG
ncbi:MAG TPA: carboxypeptidase-like regulatory domain-containing protein, partial [Gemmatimonadaceae bacterium]|nr:carboxypeptidase-like regulatory domain-containing protein [Gemmatimonadaceae bacterium]